MPLNSVEACSIPTQRGLLPSVRALLDFLAQECAARRQFVSRGAEDPCTPESTFSGCKFNALHRTHPCASAYSRIKPNAALKTSGEALRQAVTPKRLNDKIDERARLGR